MKHQTKESNIDFLIIFSKETFPSYFFSNCDEIKFFLYDLIL